MADSYNLHSGVIQVSMALMSCQTRIDSVSSFCERPLLEAAVLSRSSTFGSIYRPISMARIRPSLFVGAFFALYLDLAYSEIVLSLRDDVSVGDHMGRRSAALEYSFMARDITKSQIFHTTVVKDFGLNRFLATITSSSSSSPSPSGADSSAPTGNSASFGFLSIAALGWLILNVIIALCLILAENVKRVKKVARKPALELPAEDIPVELRGDGRYELDFAPPELKEDTFHEMFVPPIELSGDLWPELDAPTS